MVGRLYCRTGCFHSSIGPSVLASSNGCSGAVTMRLGKPIVEVRLVPHP